MERLAVFIQWSSQSLINLAQAYENYRYFCKRHTQNSQLFLICEVMSEDIEIQIPKNLSEDPSVFLYQLKLNQNLQGMKTKLEELVSCIILKTEGQKEVFFPLAEAESPVPTIFLIKLAEALPDKLHCLAGEKVDQVYDFAEQIDRPVCDRLFYTYLETCNYPAILALVRQGCLPRNLSAQVNRMVRFRNFFFREEVYLLISSNIKNIARYPELAGYTDVLEEMLGLTQKQQIPIIKALYFNCRLEFQQADFIDFLVRYLRLLEELLVYGLGWDQDGQGRMIHRIGPKAGKSISLKNKGLEDLRKEFNSELSYISKHQLFYQYINSPKVQALIDMRHLSVAGHGYHGVSTEVLSSVYEGDIILDLHRAIESLGLNVDIDYFEVLNSFLLAEYRNLQPTAERTCAQ